MIIIRIPIIFIEDLLILYLPIKPVGLLDRIPSASPNPATLQWLFLSGIFNHSLIDGAWRPNPHRFSIPFILGG